MSVIAHCTYNLHLGKAGERMFLLKQRALTDCWQDLRSCQAAVINNNEIMCLKSWFHSFFPSSCGQKCYTWNHVSQHTISFFFSIIVDNVMGDINSRENNTFQIFSLWKVYYDMINCLHIHDMWKRCLMIMYWLTWINVTISMKSSRFKKKHATVYTKL